MNKNLEAVPGSLTLQTVQNNYPAKSTSYSRHYQSYNTSYATTHGYKTHFIQHLPSEIN